MSTTVQISARVSVDTQTALAHIARATGRSRQAVLEEAVRREATALEIPEDFIIPPISVLGYEDAKKLLHLLDHPPKASAALKRTLKQAGLR